MERADQDAEIGASLGERRDRDPEPGEAREQIVAERLLGDHVVEIAVGRGDDAEVERDRSGATDRHDLALLEHAELRRLRGPRQVADLVEEQRAAIGGADEPRVVGLGAGERALLVPEQLALDEVLGERAAVDRHEPAGALR